jgi:hypothetical protein
LTLPVKLTMSETYLIDQLVGYMFKKRGGFATSAALLSEGLRSIFEMRAINDQLPFPWRRAISLDDLQVLAPYIDECIANPPQQNLWLEYPLRAEALKGLK